MPFLKHYNTICLVFFFINWLFFILSFFQNAVEYYVCYNSFNVDLSKKLIWHTCSFVFSICVNTVITLHNNFPMHGEFPFDAWLKNDWKRKKIQDERKIFWTKHLCDYDYFFCNQNIFRTNCLKGMSFIIYKHKFCGYFSLRCKGHSSQIFITMRK